MGKKKRFSFGKYTKNLPDGVKIVLKKDLMEYWVDGVCRVKIGVW